LSSNAGGLQFGYRSPAVEPVTSILTPVALAKEPMPSSGMHAAGNLRRASQPVSPGMRFGNGARRLHHGFSMYACQVLPRGGLL